MRALRRLEGILEAHSTLHTRTLPFKGHVHGSRKYPLTEQGPIWECRCHARTLTRTRTRTLPGLIGTRDDVVSGMLDFIED